MRGTTVPLLCPKSTDWLKFLIDNIAWSISSRELAGRFPNINVQEHIEHREQSRAV